MRTRASIKSLIASLLAIIGLLTLPITTLAGGVKLEDGLQVRLRAGESITSAGAREGQLVTFEVAEDIRVGESVVIAGGALAVGTVVKAGSKKVFNRNGHLSLRFDYVQAVDGSKVSLRAMSGKVIKMKQQVDERSGKSIGGAVLGMAAALAGAPLYGQAAGYLIGKGKNVGVFKGQLIDAYVEGEASVAIRNQAGGYGPATAKVNMARGFASNPAEAGGFSGSELSTVSITSALRGAEIEVDGKFVGNTPSTLRLPAGQHTIAVRHGNVQPWVRSVSLASGSSITLRAELGGGSGQMARRIGRRRR